VITTALGPRASCYRVLTPRWAHQPYSGAGAAARGGRFNRPGTPALYLSLAPETALAEFAQAATLFGPGTIAAYHLTLGHVVDFSAGYLPTVWDRPWAEWSCPWKQIAMIERRDPPSWALADTVRAAGAAGLLFPSTQDLGGTNLVIYLDLLAPDDKIEVHDPTGQLRR
jgi:RES domain-containing protein